MYFRNEKYGGSKNDHLIFNKQRDNRLCHELKKEDTTNSPDRNDDQTRQGSLSSSESSGRFQVEIKTGKQIFISFPYSIRLLRSYGIFGIGWWWN